MTRLDISAATFLFLTLCCSMALCQSLQESIADSHIRANVPDEKHFDKFLRRDLERYFKDRKKKAVTVQYELLRKGPTQTGIAYPKFYAWVTILDHEALVEEGAVRVAAVNKKQFDITDYISRADVERSPGTLDRIFPRPVADKIRERVGLRQTAGQQALAADGAIAYFSSNLFSIA